MTQRNMHKQNNGLCGALTKLREYVEASDFAGYDPYDALNSPLIRALTFGRKWGRIAWIQVLRRLPINLRPLLFISKGHNPKALGLFLEGYVRLYRRGADPVLLKKIKHLIDLLDASKTNTASGHGWGYNFNWQSKVFLIHKTIPTIVNSSFIGHALLDAAEAQLDTRALKLAEPIGGFIVNDLHRTMEGDSFCFSYTPVDQYAVHNANLLGASFLIRLGKVLALDIYRKTALAALRYSMKYQQPDGSWYYAEQQGSHWIDSFHTGFNLEAIRHFRRLNEAEEYEAAYRKGVQFYAERFFLEDGTPKYYHNSIYPIDIHAPAEAIAFFGDEPDYDELSRRILNWMLKNMADPRGYFYFRKGPYFTNKIAYMRWGQAWAFRALTASLMGNCSEREFAMTAGARH